LLGHGRAWRGGVSAWTHAHERWLLGQQFDEPALAATCSHYRAVLQSRDAQLDAIEADLAGWYDRPPFAEQVARLSAYRGITRLGALTLAAEVGHWRRFPRASAFMGSVGWSPADTAAGARPEPAAPGGARAASGCRAVDRRYEPCREQVECVAAPAASGSSGAATWAMPCWEPGPRADGLSRGRRLGRTPPIDLRKNASGRAGVTRPSPANPPDRRTEHGPARLMARPAH
jgi:hypothetical protein